MSLKNYALDHDKPMNDFGGYDNSSEDNWYSNTGNSPTQYPSSGMYGGDFSNNDMPGGTEILSVGVEDYSNEPPLLEELGIRFDHIWSKTKAVIAPTQALNEHILDDADLAGPLCYCLLLGSCLLLSGKVHFGYIYGFSIFGCCGLYVVLNLLHPSGLDMWRVCSVLGYCLLPVIGLAIVSIILSLKGLLGLILASVVIVWSTAAATRIFDAKLHLTDQYYLVAYPIMLLYSCFVLITIF